MRFVFILYVGSASWNRGNYGIKDEQTWSRIRRLYNARRNQVNEPSFSPKYYKVNKSHSLSLFPCLLHVRTSAGCVQTWLFSIDFVSTRTLEYFPLQIYWRLHIWQPNASSLWGIIFSIYILTFYEPNGIKILYPGKFGSSPQRFERQIFLNLAIKKLSSLFLLQYINGGELEGLLRDYSVHLEWSTRLYLAKDIAEGMRYLHKQGVIHRDLTSKVL